MLRFGVYDDNGPAQQWRLANAHLVGPDDLAVPGKVAFKSGHVVCRSRTHGVGLSLRYDAGAMGTLTLQTCLLPDREAPYILSVELVRHRIKMFITKSEEWQIWDLDPKHPASRLWEQARGLFTEALSRTDPIEADRIARRALVPAIEATERLALVHADILLHRRYAQRPAGSTTLGVRVWPRRHDEALRELIAKNFDVVFVPLRWRDLEVEEGTYDWEPIDRWINWASDLGKPIAAGPLLDFSKRALPKWMYVWQHDYDTCRDLAYDHIEKVIGRYQSKVTMWNIASGLNVNHNFQFTAQQMLDLTRMANLLVRQSRKRARTMVELVQPFGEHCASVRDSLTPLVFLDRLVQEGIRIDAVGVQLLFGQHRAGRSTRDLMQISNLLDRFFLLDIPVLISAMGVPSEPVDPQGGWWHHSWTPQVQSRWAARIFQIAMSKPFVETVVWTDLYDHAHAGLPGGGLISETGRPKPALARLIGLRKRLRRPLGPLKKSPLTV